MSKTQDTAEAVRDTSPWWGDPRAARLLHRAAADGAVILTEADYIPEPDDRAGDDWALFVDYGTAGWVQVQYTTETGFWKLEIDTMAGLLSSLKATADDHVTASFAVARAATLCRDLNKLVKRDQDLRPNVSDEVAALMGDWGMEPLELAAALSITPGVLMSKLSGATAWTPVDLARLHHTFGYDAMDRLYAALMP